jgi:cell wall-associated NlpC family hydrolase
VEEGEPPAVATVRAARPVAPRLIALVLTVLAAVAAAIVPAATSSAAPRLTLGQVEARVNALNDEAERITEAYNSARDGLAALEQKRLVAAHDLARDQAALATARKRIGATANYAYRSGGLGGVVSLADMSNPDNFLSSSAMLDEVARFQAAQVAAVAAAQHDVAGASARVIAQEQAAKKALAGIAEDRARIEGLLAQARHLLNSLRAADRARYFSATNSNASSMRALRGSYHGPASGRAAVAVRFAYNQLGKPYYYGGAGPNSYDCSGLTMRSWGAAGVSLPHNAAAQQSSTRYVSRSDLQPGDLVFFGSPAYHVAIYIGGGRVIAAPHTGDVVKIQSLSSMGSYSGAGRP